MNTHHAGSPGVRRAAQPPAGGRECAGFSTYLRRPWVLAALVLVGLGAPAGRAFADKPSVIRIAFPGVGVGNRPFVGGHSTAVLHLKGLLDEEFKKDGIQIAWTFLRGAGPAVNELYANGLADFSLLGDLPSIVGRASGLRTRVLAATAIRGNTYVAVPADSSIQSLKDLKGKKVAVFKGTNIQLAVAKLLEANGLSEKAIRAINMDQATSRAALITKDIDAAFGGPELLALRDQGAARIVYRTNGDPAFLRHCSFVGSEDFIKKYPAITERVIKQLVIAAKWISDQDKSPAPVFQLWAKSGVPFSNYKEDNLGQSLKVLSSPLIDPYLTSQYKQQIAGAKRYGLIKTSFDFDAWADTRFLRQALKELGLENYWESFDPAGKATRVSTASPSVAPNAPVEPAALAGR
jgi:sulfonate transport system substrate-binding protein